jgi:hypothetical protein
VPWELSSDGDTGDPTKTDTGEGALRCPLFGLPLYDVTALVALSFSVSNSERSQQHGADKEKGGAESQNIQSQGKVHIGLPSWLD